MHEFRVTDMTCDHCAGRITEALKQADTAAKVVIDIDAHTVRVDTKLQAEDIAATIQNAGYTPEANIAGV